MKIAEATGSVTRKGSTWRSRIIEGDRWGSSGYYPREVLERDGAKTWPAGTHVYFDHPSVSEAQDRPERSVRDLAGKLVSDPVYDSDGLYAEVEFYPHTAPIVEAMAGDIGMSIRASAEVEAGEAGGRTGWIVTSLSDGDSVDLVTKAGAGGKLIALMESARQQIDAAEKLPGGGTVDDLRRQLDGVVKLAHPDAYAYIMDFTDTWVVYEVNPKNSPARTTIYRQDYVSFGNALALSGDPVAVRPRTVYEPVPTTVPADPAGQPETATESLKEDTMATIQIEETEHRSLMEKAGRVENLETQLAEASTKAAEAIAEAKRQIAETDKAKADAIIAEAGAEFSALEKRGLLASLPVTEAGRLDEAKFTEQVTEAATEKAAQAGAGQPQGVGQTAALNESITDWASFDAELAKIKEA